MKWSLGARNALGLPKLHKPSGFELSKQEIRPLMEAWKKLTSLAQVKSQRFYLPSNCQQMSH